jgi:CRP/FNR family cyclic AMP-dependent transcriptional regulator
LNLKSNQEFRRDLVQNCQLVLCRPEEYLIRQDEKASEVFVIASGDCEVYVKDWQVKENRELYVRTLYQGMYFGEIALMNNTVRSATVKSRNYSVLGRISGSHFHDCLFKHPDIRKSLNSNIEMY